MKLKPLASDRSPQRDRARGEGKGKKIGYYRVVMGMSGIVIDTSKTGVRGHHSHRCPMLRSPRPADKEGEERQRRRARQREG